MTDRTFVFHGRLDHAYRAIEMPLPAFFDRTPEKEMEQIFRAVLKNERNASQIREFSQYFPALVRSAKSEWSHASDAYSEKWRDPNEFLPGERKAIRAANNDLAERLHDASTKYERYDRLLAMYRRLKAKYEERGKTHTVMEVQSEDDF